MPPVAFGNDTDFRRWTLQDAHHNNAAVEVGSGPSRLQWPRSVTVAAAPATTAASRGHGPMNAATTPVPHADTNGLGNSQQLQLHRDGGGLPAYGTTGSGERTNSHRGSPVLAPAMDHARLPTMVGGEGANGMLLANGGQSGGDPSRHGSSFTHHAFDAQHVGGVGSGGIVDISSGGMIANGATQYQGRGMLAASNLMAHGAGRGTPAAVVAAAAQAAAAAAANSRQQQHQHHHHQRSMFDDALGMVDHHAGGGAPPMGARLDGSHNSLVGDGIMNMGGSGAPNANGVGGQTMMAGLHGAPPMGTRMNHSGSSGGMGGAATPTPSGQGGQVQRNLRAPNGAMPSTGSSSGAGVGAGGSWLGGEDFMSMALASVPHGASELPASAVPTVLERFPGFVRCVMDIAPEVVGWVIGRSGAHIKEMKVRSW